MANWVNKYHDLIRSGHKKHILLSDPDGLLNYAGLVDKLNESGYELISAASELEVRLHFELTVRYSVKKYILVGPSGYDPPPDILQFCTPHRIGLVQIFPNLDPGVLRGVSFDLLYKLFNLKVYEKLGTKETQNLVMKFSSLDDIAGLPELLQVNFYEKIDKNNENRLKIVLEQLAEQFEEIEDEFEQWFVIIKVIAEAKLRTLTCKDSELTKRYYELEQKLNSRFQLYLDNYYAGLFSLSGIRKPVVVSRILEYLKAQSPSKKALIVLDGMNYWQWLAISDDLRKSGFSFSAKTTMSYIPSITSWSRQAIFKGSNPDLNENNSKEKQLFHQFWGDCGLSSYQIKYQKFGVGNEFIPDNIPEDVQILGLVCNDLDEMMHGAIMGDIQLLSSTIQWADKCNISGIVGALRERGFKVFLTTDHGNIEATGIGNLKIKDKAGSITRSKRFLDFANDVLRDGYIEQNRNLEIGVNGTSIYLKNKDAFEQEGVRVVTHGGSHFFEVLIPFIEIEGI